MSTNQYIAPITKEERDNQIYIGGCKLSDLAQEYGTPLYVMDEQTIRKTCQEYKSAFSGYPNAKMMYASKALCNMAISKVIASEGFGFDVVSIGEIYTLYKAGIDMTTLMFNGSNKTYSEIEQALNLGVTHFSIDNYYEVDLLAQATKKLGKKVEGFLRITPGIECHTHEYIQTGQLDSKFGFNLLGSNVNDIIKYIQSSSDLIDITGLHAHIGSQIFELQCFYDEVEVLIKEILRIKDECGIEIKNINIGGGLGVKYTNSDIPPSIEDAANVIIRSLNENIAKYDLGYEPTLYMEPGRSIISTAGVTLYTLGSIKEIPNIRKYVSIDGGMADNPRPSMYQAEYVAQVANNVQSDENEKVTISGRYCESGDILIKDITLPKISAGDILCVYNTGAYNYSMSSNYNKATKPAMVLVNNSQSDMIIYRETLDDLVSKDCVPDRLV